MATVTAFTALSIADAYRRFLPGRVDDIVLCGGGARNATLAAMLARALAPAKVLPMDELGIDADAKEAVSFAILAAATYSGPARQRARGDGGQAARGARQDRAGAAEITSSLIALHERQVQGLDDVALGRELVRDIAAKSCGGDCPADAGVVQFLRVVHVVAAGVACRCESGRSTGYSRGSSG